MRGNTDGHAVLDPARRSDAEAATEQDRRDPDDSAVPAELGRESAAAREEEARGRGQRFRLRNWRVRSRLLLLVAVPTLVAVILGGFSVASSARNAIAYQRVEKLANLAGGVTDLVGALQNERQDIVTYIAMAGQGGRSSTPAASGPERSLLSSDYLRTNQAAKRVRALASSIDGSYPPLAQQQAQSAIAAISNLPALRTAATTTKVSALTVITAYGNMITQLLTLEDQVAAEGNSASLAGNVRLLTLVSAMKEESAQQQAVLTSALRPNLIGVNRVGAQSLAVLNNEAAQLAANLTTFNLAATASQRRRYDSVLQSPASNQAQQQVRQAISLLQSGTSAAADPTYAAAASSASYAVGSFGTVEHQLVSAVISQSAALRRSAIEAAILSGLAVLLALILAILLTAMVGRSMVRPLRRLRAGALEIAGIKLPEAVRQMSETDGTTASFAVEPIDIGTSDEIGEVARAFDQVHREALRLAATEAALRGNINAMFVNLSRRSQSLIERQIRLIDNLEQSEQDAERLGSLFQMDHLATRMRRNSENLLVLAGHDMARRWNQPIALVDVLRAAVSEIEQYERVSLNVQPGISVRGQAVNDVVHLTAELVENATSFSPADSPVSITGHLLGSGGVLLEITDSGVGMGAEEMAHANWRLDNPPVVDVAVSRRMGLYVVARLAARHGIRVRLRPAPSGGLTALVWLPDETIRQDEAGLGIAPGDRWSDARAAATFASAAGEWDPPARSVAEQEVSAARTPRFTPLQAGEAAAASERAEADSGLDRRVPGSGPRPGADSGDGDWPDSGNWSGSTGPMPVFRTSPQPAPRDADSGDGAGSEDGDRETAASNGTSGNGTGPAGAAWAAAAGAAFAGTAFGEDTADDASGQVPAGQDAEPEASAPSAPPDPAERTETADDAAAPAAQEPGTLPKRDTRRGWRPPEEQLTRPSVDMFGKAASPAPAASEESTPAPAGNGQGEDSPVRPRFAPRFAGFGQKAGSAEAGASAQTGPAAEAAEDSSAPASNGDRAGGSGFASPSGTAPSFADSAPGDEPAGPAADEAAAAAGGAAGLGGAGGPRDAGGPGGAAEPQGSPAGSGSGTGGNGVPAPGRWSPGSSLDSVVIPPAASMAEQNRLPIFEQVESDWFRRGRPPVSQPSAGSAGTNGLSHAGDQAAAPPADEAAAAGGGAANGAAEAAPEAAGGETAAAAETEAAEAAAPAGAATSAAAASEAAPDAVAQAPVTSGGWSSPADEGWRAAEAVSEPASGGLTHAGLPKRVPRANLVPGAVGAESQATTPVRSAAVTRDRLSSFQRGIRQARAASSGDQPGSEVSDDDSPDS